MQHPAVAGEEGQHLFRDGLDSLPKVSTQYGQMQGEIARPGVIAGLAEHADVSAVDCLGEVEQVHANRRRCESVAGTFLHCRAMNVSVFAGTAERQFQTGVRTGH